MQTKLESKTNWSFPLKVKRGQFLIFRRMKENFKETLDKKKGAKAWGIHLAIHYVFLLIIIISLKNKKICAPKKKKKILNFISDDLI